MIRRIPLRIMPAIGLIILWGLALFCNLFGGAIDTFGAHCARVAMPLTIAIVPFTIFSSLISNDKPDTNRRSRKRGSILTSTTIASILAFLTVLLLSQGCTLYVFERVASQLERFRPGFFLEHPNTSVIQAAIPRGETKIADLSEEITKYLNLPSWREDGTDHWGNPYILVAEDRDNKLWLGLYSMGRDGVTASSGNDPDDLNSWGKNGSDYYWPEIQRQALKEFFMKFCIAFLFYFSICFLISRLKISDQSS